MKAVDHGRDRDVDGVGPRPAAAEGLPPKVNVVQHSHGLYQLIIVRQENQDHSFVSKPVPLVNAFARFCNDVAAGSFDEDARSVDFGRLDETRVKATALFGYNSDVWRALVDVGLEGGEGARERLQEGLLVWCPWLAAAASQDGDAMSTDSWQLQGMDTVDTDSASLLEDERRVYVAAWAGDAVEQPGLHPPFNLMLRLLVALCPDIIIPVSSTAAAAFDGSAKPFESGEGITEDYSVQQHTSANTDVQIGDSKRLTVQLDPRLWQTGALREHVTDVSSDQVALNWHSGAKGATLVASYYATLTGIRNATCKAAAPDAPCPGTHKIELCPHLLTLLRQEHHRLHLDMRRLMPGTHARGGKLAVQKHFVQVLEHAAVRLLQHWSPDAVAQKRQTLSALQDEVVAILTESGQRHTKRPGAKAESDQELQAFIIEASEQLMQHWFGCGLTSTATPTHALAEPSMPHSGPEISKPQPALVEPTTLYRDVVKGLMPASSSAQAPFPLDPPAAIHVDNVQLSAVPVWTVLHREEKRLTIQLAEVMDTAWLVQCLAEPFAWELMLQEACAPRTKLPADIVQQELARLTGQGASRFVGAQGRSARLRELGIALGKPVTLHQVFARVHDKLLNSDGEPTKEFKTLLRKHPHTTEIICVLAARAIALLPREQRVGEDGQALPQVYTMFQLSVAMIATLADFTLPVRVPPGAMVHAFSKGAVEVLRPFLPAHDGLLESGMGAEVDAFEQEASCAGFTRQDICLDVAMVAVMQQHVPEPYSDYFSTEEATAQGPQRALEQCQARYDAAERETSERKTLLGRLRSMIPGSKDTDKAPTLDFSKVIGMSTHHAKMLIRASSSPVAPLLQAGLPREVVRQLVQAVASRVVAGLLQLKSPGTEFANTKNALDARRDQALKRDLLQRFSTAEGELSEWLNGIVEELQAAADASLLSPSRGTTIRITGLSSQIERSTYTNRNGGAAIVLDYRYESKSSAFGSWTAQVLSKSAQGEDADVALGCEVVHHEERVDYVEVLGVAAGPASASIISVRVTPGQSPHQASTEVLVYPKSQKPDHFRHIKASDRRPVLAARYEPSSRIIALLLPAEDKAAAQKHAVAFFAFTPDFKQLQKTHELPVTLQGKCTVGPGGALVYQGEVPFVLLPAVADREGAGMASKMALILEPDRVRVYNILVKTCEPESLATATAGKQWLCTPCRTALLAVRHDSGLGRWVVDAYALEDAGTAQELFWKILEDEALPDDVALLPPEGPRFTTACVDGDTFLLAANGNDLFTTVLKLQSIHVENTLAKHGVAGDGAQAASATNRLLNYVHSCCLRFPLDDCIGLAEAAQRAQRGENTVCRTVRLHIATPQPELGQAMVEYTQDLLQHALQIASQKPSGRLLALQPCSATSVLDAAADVKAAGEELGRWMRTAMCLLPLQLSRCMGNTLEPMHDGEPRRGVDASAADGDIDGMARALRLGLYESVLASHTGPVKFVCALGQQSMGKSYQLNHLGGTLFDVAGGRCTDGVWLSARFMRDAAGAETAIVFLDCEGIGSPQRHEVEDMLHCLLVGAVSSLTMFKTHFAFTTELMETLKRINKGAERVADICGYSGAGAAAAAGTPAAASTSSRAPVAPPRDRRVFRGSIMFCLKDVSPDSMRSIIRDFNKPLNSMVRSGDNFVSAIYNNKLSVSAFPGLSRAFYTTLQRDCVSRLQHPDCPSYGSGADASYTLKMMLMKVAHKDWTAIHRQLIVSKAKALRALMPAVVHHGCEATLQPDGAPLGPALPLQFSSANEDAPSSDDLEKVTFNVTLPAYVHAAIQDLLKAAVQASSGSLSIQAAGAAGAVSAGQPVGAMHAVAINVGAAAQATLQPHMFAQHAGHFAASPLAEPVGEALEEDDDDASSMGASGFGEAVAGLGLSENPFAVLSMDNGDADMAPERADAASDVSMRSGKAPGGDGMDGEGSGDDWDAEMGVDVLGGGAGGASGVGAGGLLGLYGGLARLSPPPVGGAAAGAPHEAHHADVHLMWTVVMPDQELRLGGLVQGADGAAGVPPQLLQEDVQKLKARLVALLQLDRPDKDPNQFRLLHAVLQACVQALLLRRRGAATAWLEQAADPIRDTPEASELQSTLLEHLRRLEDALQVCSATCASCLLPCWALGAHSTHSCGTDHRCQAACDFCVLERAHAAVCSGKAGHHGRHMCRDRPHACGKPCALGNALNCNGACAKVPQHDGPCDCECGNHLCGAACSLPGCGERCKEPWGSQHDRHSCGATACPQKCPLCGNGCPEGHFHALEQPKSHHLCGAEHHCMQPGTRKPRQCAHKGACCIEGTVERVARKFKGKRGEFEYDGVTRQNMARKVCTVMVPPGALVHDGPCSCGNTSEEHYCGHPCPQCLYRCTKAVGHEGLHRCPHGNLENNLLVASTDEFDLKDRKYAVGDSAQAETCDSFCTNCGRGHLHYVQCDKAICESALHDGARHSTQQFVNPDGAGGPGRGKPPARDELTHDFHWQQMQFEDPVTAAEDLQLFRMCGNYCNCEEHLQADGTLEKKYCLLPLWHAPLSPQDDPHQHKPADCHLADVFISEDGCLLPCKHVTASDVHTFLVIDRSGSMGSMTIQPDSSDVRNHHRFHVGGDLDTVLGVVYEAAHKYILERAARAPRDVVTFIPFNDQADIKFTGWHVRDPAQLLDKMMRTGPNRGTKFDSALWTMQRAVAEWRAQGTSNLKPVAILLTDSEDWVKATSVDVMRQIMEAEKGLPEAERLTVHVIGFGPGVDEGFIQQLATIGCGSHFTCQAARDIDRTNLVRAFSRIASRPADQVALVPS